MGQAGHYGASARDLGRGILGLVEAQEIAEPVATTTGRGGRRRQSGAAAPA